jgi:hyperosmotically inducible periplasmic protein
MKVRKYILAAALSAGCLFGTAPFTLAFASGFGQSNAADSSQNDTEMQAELTKALNKSQLKNVHATVANGIVTLSGTTDLYSYKVEAEKRVHRVKNIVAVRNQIEVAGTGDMSDRELQQKLVEKLQYDRVGYGNAFNAIGVNVQDGVVTLSGHARTPVDKDSAISLVSNYPGVKDLVDDVEVDPVSPIDDRIRLQVARSVYGFPSLNKYAINPAKPIRISVQNGHVELNGVVDSKADKDTAYIRANSVPGVFSVTNNLVVVNEASEKSRR